MSPKCSVGLLGVDPRAPPHEGPRQLECRAWKFLVVTAAIAAFGYRAGLGIIGEDPGLIFNMLLATFDMDPLWGLI